MALEYYRLEDYQKAQECLGDISSDDCYIICEMSGLTLWQYNYRGREKAVDFIKKAFVSPAVQAKLLARIAYKLVPDTTEPVIIDIDPLDNLF